MQTAFEKAIELMITADPELLNILGVTAKMSLSSSLIALLLGVPLGLLAAFALKLTIPFVYFILSLEECIRFGISAAVFRRRTWMQSLETAAAGLATELPPDSVL